MIWTIVCFVISAVVVVVDQITKILAVNLLSPLDGRSYEVIKGVLSFSYVENDGMAMGMLDDARWVFMTVSTIAIIGFIVYMIKWRPKSKFACVALSLIIGGGIGNMIDRIFYTGFVGDTAGEKVVRDFIDVNIFGDLWPWVFNVADACVCVGGGMLLLWCIISMIAEAKAEKLAKAQGAAESICNEASDSSEESAETCTEKQSETKEDQSEGSETSEKEE